MKTVNLGTKLRGVFALFWVWAFMGAAVERQSVKTTRDSEILSYVVDPKSQNVELFWKDVNGRVLGNIGNLKKHVESRGKILTFAMNGGMYDQNRAPVGLFVENEETIVQLNTFSGLGNFYLNPNGVFFLTRDNEAFVSPTPTFKNNGQIRFATQSGPMLVVAGVIPGIFSKGSKSRKVRNGVGVLPDGQILFAMSRGKVNFYEFAQFFQRSGCKNALYLDGTISKMYLPQENWLQTDGDLGVMIGVTEKM